MAARLVLSRTASAALALAALAPLLATTGTARADGLDEGVAFKSVAVQGNPLGLVIGRYSADLEYLPQPHHALHLTPVGYFALPGVADELVGGGVELGYRYYTGADGPQGFFLGGSAVVLSLRYLHAPAPNLPSDAPEDTSYVQLGGAIDAGYQMVLFGNFAAGAGVGAQYTTDTTQPHFEPTTHAWRDLVYGWGLRPRALLSLGAAF